MKANILGVVVTAAGLATAVPDDQYPIVFPDDGNGTHTSFPAVQPQPISTVTSDIAAAAAMAKTESPVSSVKGKAFDRFMTIFLEINSYTDVINEREPPVSLELFLGHTLTRGGMSTVHPPRSQLPVPDQTGPSADQHVRHRRAQPAELRGCR